ncbi:MULTISPECIES: aldose 1-epimerase [Dyella]|uniref:Aldose epimerase n=2 Tax=Dyella TaxID=231454 RepID=A0A4R0YJI4_9GAMM|nr:MULTISPECIES: aldose epimerase [Dyella]TBR36031.1 aldose epimerase [Dyella terrae]TCI06080.1 aldose epimerase [Dyella soli]
MVAFRAERTTVGPHEIAVLHDDANGRKVRIARRGATVMSIEQAWQGTSFDLADGYRDAAELDSRPSSRFAVMVPFANRIADARYTFDGTEYDLQPGVEGDQRAARHGFVRGVDFDLTERHADEAGARVTFTTQAIRPGVHPGYPFAIDLTVTYVLNAQGLEVRARMHNVGEQAAPCFFGWHPYFRLGETPIEQLELKIPARQVVRTDAQYIPLEGDAARAPLEREAGLDFRSYKIIGAQELNHAWADLVPDADGRARTWLRDPANGLAIALWQASGVMLGFTADTVTRDVRGSVALEPMESWSNAFNRADCAQAIRLEAGEARTYRCGVEIVLP